MEFNIKQVNNLLTGVTLACELDSDTTEIRKFLTVSSFNKKADGKAIPWDNTIKSYDTGDNAIFKIHYYSLSESDMEYDINNNDLIDNVVINDIHGWEQLYKELLKIVDDLEMLVPEWQCDNPL